jgi:hypothetical protein
VHCHQTPCCSQLCTLWHRTHTQYDRDMHHCQGVGVRSPQNHHQASLDAPLSCCDVYDARLPIHDGAGADVLVRGKQLPAAVLMRGGGRRCTWSVDAASGLSARVLEDTRDGMPGRREGWCMGCGWDMVVVVYVGETVHQSAPQLQAPTHRPQDLGQMS